MEARTTPPPRRRRSDSRHNWDVIAASLREEPAAWVLAASGVSNTMAWRAGRGDIAALRALGGQVHSHHRDTYTEQGASGSTRYGDLWLKWTPEGWTEDDDTVQSVVNQVVNDHTI